MHGTATNLIAQLANAHTDATGTETQAAGGRSAAKGQGVSQGECAI